MTYETHQKLSSRLLADLETPPPPGFQRVTYAQIRAADEKAWDMLAQETRKGIVDVGFGRTNVDEAMDKVLGDLRFTMLLLPRQRAVGGEPAPKKPRKGKEGKGAKAWENKGPKAGPKGGKAQKGKNKGKGKGKPRTPPMPAELVGGVAFTDDEPPQPICFSFNCAAGCAWAEAGALCQRGKHVCCAPGCFAAHPYTQHPWQ